MKYFSGDLINQSCTDCQKIFDYVYPGKGRPIGHRCPECLEKHWERNKMGSTIIVSCKDCGKTFEYKTFRGRTLERCESCRPTKIGTLITSNCENCKVEFSYKFSHYFHKLCKECVTTHKKDQNSSWCRNKRSGIKEGTILQFRCSQCNSFFSYTSFKRRRKLCDECYSSKNLMAMEKMTNVPNQWSLEKWRLTLGAFGEICVYCEKSVRYPHRDHFIPYSLGGISDIGNIVPSCKSCNSRKSAKLPSEFLSAEKYLYVVKVLSQLTTDYPRGFWS